MLYQDLDNSCNVLDQMNLDNEIKYETDFMVAYRGHIFQIQQQIRELKKKLTDDEVRIKRDEKVQTLSRQFEWFKNEALELKEELNQKKVNDYKFTQDNFILGQEKWAFEKALGSAQDKTTNLTKDLDAYQNNN